MERKVEWEVPVERTCYLGGEEERIEMEGGQQKKVKVSVPGLHPNFAWEEDIPREKLVTDSTVHELVAENDRQLRDGEIAPGETILPVARPDMEIKWEGPHDAELFRGQGQGPGFGAIRDGHLQTDPLTRLMLRYDGFEESSGRLRVRGRDVRLDAKERMVLRSRKGHALNARVARTALALHMRHHFTHCAAVDGSRSGEEGHHARVSYGVYEGPAPFGQRQPGERTVRCAEEEIESAVARGAWGGRLPGSWEAVDAEVYAVLAYLRRMALQQNGEDEPRRCLIISDCKPALHQIESAWRQGVPQGFRERDRGAMLEAICKYRATLGGVVLAWVPAHAGVACNAYADAVAKACLADAHVEEVTRSVGTAVVTRPCLYERVFENGSETRVVAGASVQVGGRVSLQLTCSTKKIERRDLADRRPYYEHRHRAGGHVREEQRKTISPGSHTAGVTGKLWSEVVRAGLAHKWDRRMMIEEDPLPGQDRPESRRVELGDVQHHNAATKAVLGARAGQQVGVPHGAHHKRMHEAERAAGKVGPATRSHMRGCLVCKRAREARLQEAMGPFGPLRPDGQAARARACKERQRWTDEDENPPLADLAHIYGGTCEGMKESSGRAVMDTAAQQSQQAIKALEKATKNAEAPVRLLRRARAVALGSRYRALTVEDFEEVRPVIGCVLPDWSDSSLPQHTRAQVSKQVATRLQTVRDVAAGTCSVWMEKHKQAMSNVEQREQAMGWLQQTFRAWRKETEETQEQAATRRNYMTRSGNTRNAAQDNVVQVRKENAIVRDTPRGRRCKDFTDDAGYLRREWARLRLAMLRNARERQTHTARPGAPTSAVQPTTSSDYTARRGQMHMQARIGMKLMRIIEGDRDRRAETEDHG